MTKQPLERYLGHYLLGHPEDLSKMIFRAGPRQVGKTTLLENLGPKLGYKDILYLNWDRPKDRGMIRDAKYSAFSDLVANAKAKPLVVFDEIHKYPKWKSFLKGYFDTFRKQISTCVTGSARLDVYRCGGDSLFGRYWLLHFNPITVGELLDKETLLPPKEFITKPDSAVEEAFTSLAKWGGFPEPLFSGSDTQHRRWLKMRRERLVGEDLRDLSKIHDLSHVENLMDLVIASVGSTLSVNSLRESLGVSYNAVTTWLKWLEAIYYCFAISPYSKGVARGLKKERKYYLYDWSEVTDEGARFENIVAVHLKKSIDFWNDIGTGTFSFNYIRDLEKREVDFLVL
jgi:predicted AAA+ superfamily ATPase